MASSGYEESIDELFIILIYFVLFIFTFLSCYTIMLFIDLKSMQYFFPNYRIDRNGVQNQ